MRRFFFVSIFFIGVLLFGCSFNQLDGDNPADTEDYTRRPVAHFDLVPYRTIEAPFSVGVPAFHKDGIEKVIFTFTDSSGNTGTLQSSVMTENTRTGVMEFWVMFDPAEYDDGTIIIDAEVIPCSGSSRLLQSCLVNNSGGSLTGKSIYVHPADGNDELNDGQDREHPFKTIARALDNKTVTGGDTIILMAEGNYIAPDRTDIPGHMGTKVDRYITIRPDTSGMDVTITGDPDSFDRIYPKVSHLKWENVTFDVSDLNDYYRYRIVDTDYVWLDHCEIIDTLAWNQIEDNTYLGNFSETGYYATDSVVNHSKYGFTFARLARNCRIRDIAGDCYQMSRCLLNCSVANVDWEALEHHTDVYQMWDEFDNLLVYGLDGTNVYCQNFMLEPDRENSPGVESLTNSAFVDISIDNHYNNSNGAAGGPPWSHLAGQFKHVLFYNLDIQKQRFCFRTDSKAQPFVGEDVIMKNCDLVLDPYADYSADKPPEGVSFINCNFLYPPLN